ncbi:hypothetical protein PR048_008340 [Dryococelus australis]|uniref:Uncharacterized protein n=1 Tax=Dryococelus australis TaxID=614101 RepID=A0ABQ9HXM8_9NEOP|nr:hypothetical protein PR048_008340 [Dryococelus australis]
MSDTEHDKADDESTQSAPGTPSSIIDSNTMATENITEIVNDMFSFGDNSTEANISIADNITNAQHVCEMFERTRHPNARMCDEEFAEVIPSQLPQRHKD